MCCVVFAQVIGTLPESGSEKNIKWKRLDERIRRRVSSKIYRGRLNPSRSRAIESTPSLVGPLTNYCIEELAKIKIKYIDFRFKFSFYFIFYLNAFCGWATERVRYPSSTTVTSSLSFYLNFFLKCHFLPCWTGVGRLQLIANQHSVTSTFHELTWPQVDLVCCRSRLREDHHEGYPGSNRKLIKLSLLTMLTRQWTACKVTACRRINYTVYSILCSQVLCLAAKDARVLGTAIPFRGAQMEKVTYRCWWW